MQYPNYGDNPEYYKRLIAKINEEANFPMYLHQNGYSLTQQSAGSMEFQNDHDRIVLQTKRKPTTYFNRNDSLDKGLFFTYLMRRSANFYKAIENGLEISNQGYALDNQAIQITKPPTFTTSMEENYNIVPLRNSTYLRTQRCISQKTLGSVLFKGRIFNAYHVRDNGGKIANIAFPKYDLQDNRKNYILYNRPYRSKVDNEVKKFRLVLNRKDHFLFCSRPSKCTKRIIFGESGIDLLSYYELHGKKDDFYISLGGNVYKEKLHFFAQRIEPMLQYKGIELISIMDNDSAGHVFDLKVFTSVINHCNSGIYAETSFRNDSVGLRFHYTEKIRHRISAHKELFEESLTAGIRRGHPVFGLVRCVGFSDKLLLEFELNEAIRAVPVGQRQSVFKTLLDTINSLYLPFSASIHKSRGKDWNDDLRASKKTKFVEMETVIPKDLAIGDKIGLNRAKGPEGTTNKGLIIALKPNSVECDFGLAYTYAIPYSSIGAHYKSTNGLPTGSTTEIKKKNNNLQNHML